MKTGKSALTKPRTGLSVDKTVIAEDPGETQTVVARIHNTTAVEREFHAEVVGLGTTGEKGEPATVPIAPGATEQVSLGITIPTKIAPGCHLLAVRAWVGDKESPEIDWYTELRLEIADGQQARIEVKPVVVEMHHRSKATVSVQNLGDEELRFSLEAIDPEGIVNVRFTKDKLDVPPRRDAKDGASTKAILTIKEWHVFGEPIPRIVDITADGPGASHATTLRIEQRPYVPMWLVKTVGTLALVVAFITLMVILVRIFILDNPAPAWRELESPLSARANHTALWVEFPKPDLGSTNPFYQVYKTVLDTITREDDFIEAMIIWGGGDDKGAFEDGAIYLVGAEEWRSIADDNAPIRRLGHTAVWTGSRMLIWGGRSTPREQADKDNTNTALPMFPPGGAYDPVSEAWSTLGELDINGRYQHTAVWADNYGMIVWGGRTDTEFFGDGWLYCDTDRRDNNRDPECIGPPDKADTGEDWTRIPPISSDDPLHPEDKDAPTARAGHVTVWTGTDLIVWGGYNSEGQLLADGARFDVAEWKWHHLPDPGSSFKPRAFAKAVWTDEAMLILGGIGDGEVALVTEAASKTDDTQPADDQYGVISPKTPEVYELARRTGLSVDAVLHALAVPQQKDQDPTERFRRLDGTVALYQRESNSWDTAENEPPVSSDPVVLWTEPRLRLVFGVAEVDTISSIAWVPGETWERLPLPGPNEIIPARTGHTAVWIRGGLLVWGGRSAATECSDQTGCFLNDGGILPIPER